MEGRESSLFLPTAGILSYKQYWVEGISPSELITPNYFKAICLCKQLLMGAFCSSIYTKDFFSLDITHFVSCCWQNILMVLPPTLRSWHMMEYISPKSKLKFSSYLFLSVSPSDCAGITGSRRCSFPVRALRVQALLSWGVGIWNMV